jgi:hypothetical protein
VSSVKHDGSNLLPPIYNTQTALKSSVKRKTVKLSLMGHSKGVGTE